MDEAKEVLSQNIAVLTRKRIDFIYVAGVMALGAYEGIENNNLSFILPGLGALQSLIIREMTPAKKIPHFDKLPDSEKIRMGRVMFFIFTAIFTATLNRYLEVPVYNIVLSTLVTYMIFDKNIDDQKRKKRGARHLVEQLLEKMESDSGPTNPVPTN